MWLWHWQCELLWNSLGTWTFPLFSPFELLLCYIPSAWSWTSISPFSHTRCSVILSYLHNFVCLELDNFFCFCFVGCSVRLSVILIMGAWITIWQQFHPFLVPAALPYWAALDHILYVKLHLEHKSFPFPPCDFRLSHQCELLHRQNKHELGIALV